MIICKDILIPFKFCDSKSQKGRFVLNGNDIVFKENTITVQLKRKGNLPIILEVMLKYSRQKNPWLNKMDVIFEGKAYS